MSYSRSLEFGDFQALTSSLGRFVVVILFGFLLLLLVLLVVIGAVVIVIVVFIVIIIVVVVLIILPFKLFLLIVILIVVVVHLNSLSLGTWLQRRRLVARGRTELYQECDRFPGTNQAIRWCHRRNQSIVIINPMTMRRQ